MTGPLRLAVALDGAGRHPAAWRATGARPADLLTAGYWAGLVQEAERGLLDLVTFEDDLHLQSTLPNGPDDRTDLVRGRLDSLLVAARVAPLTTGIGLLPTVVATHTEPFHVSKAVATLDHVSRGRAGVVVTVSHRADEAAAFGRRALELAHPIVLDEDLHAEAADHVEVQRRLWDSWEDDAEIRDAATGRFVDREKLHYVDFEGRWFSVKGPSITPRPPQGQPVVAAVVAGPAAAGFVAVAADLAFLPAEHAPAAADLQAAVAAAGRTEPLRVLADLPVLLDDDPGRAAARLAELDALLPAVPGGPDGGSRQGWFAGTPEALADHLLAVADLLSSRGVPLDGFRLHPAVLPHDLTVISRSLVPALQRRGAFRDRYPGGTLRDLLGLPRPANRYAARRADVVPAAGQEVRA